MTAISSLSAWAVANNTSVNAVKDLAELIAAVALVIAIVAYVIRDPNKAAESIIRRA